VPDKSIWIGRKFFHPCFISQDAPFGDSARRINGQHGQPVSLPGDVFAQGLNEGALPHTRRSGDTHTDRGLPGLTIDD